MPPSVITVRELHRHMAGIAKRVKRGERFLVLKHAKPVFRIEPANEPVKNRRFVLKDIGAIRFKGNKTLSRDIDRILYGS